MKRMGRINDEVLRVALTDWLRGDQLGVAATLSFRDVRGGRPPGEEAASAAIAHYLRRLDGAAFGRGGLRRGEQVQAIAVREGGLGTSTRIHYHLRLPPPETFPVERWLDTCARCWREVKLAGEQNRFRIESDRGWLAYILKTRTKADLMESMDVLNWRLAPLDARSDGRAEKLNRAPSAWIAKSCLELNIGKTN